jgi:hypothetical protein
MLKGQEVVLSECHELPPIPDEHILSSVTANHFQLSYQTTEPSAMPGTTPG